MTAVAAIDVVLIAVVLGYGLTRHAVDPIAQPVYLLRTVAPFWLGWLVAATAFGVYSMRATATFPRTLVGVASSWVVAVLIGGGIRASSLVPGEAPPIFLVVTTGVGLCVLLPWHLGIVGVGRIRES